MEEDIELSEGDTPSQAGSTNIFPLDMAWDPVEGTATGTQPRVEVFDGDDHDVHDTTAQQAAAGNDLQGIPWDNLHFTRDYYRQQRLATFRNYTNLIEDGCDAEQQTLLARCKQPRAGGRYYDFVRNWRAVQSSFVHFQLRNLVWAVSPHDVFVVYENKVNHWSTVTRSITEVLNLRGPPKGPRIPGVGRVQVSCCWCQP